MGVIAAVKHACNFMALSYVFINFLCYCGFISHHTACVDFYGWTSHIHVIYQFSFFFFFSFPSLYSFIQNNFFLKIL
jgi:hypothetical protein